MKEWFLLLNHLLHEFIKEYSVEKLWISKVITHTYRKYAIMLPVKDKVLDILVDIVLNV